METKTKIRNHIAKLRHDAMFTTREMLGHGQRSSVDWALWEMVRTGEIIRLAWGLFVKANHPAPEAITEREIAAAKATAFGKRLMSDGADIASSQGLPAQPNSVATYQTDGSSTRFKCVLHKTWIIFKGTSARKMRLGDEKLGAVIRGLWQLPQKVFKVKTAQTLYSKMKRTERERLESSIRWMPSWLSDSFDFKYMRGAEYRGSSGNLIVREAQTDYVSYIHSPLPLLRLNC